MIVSERSELSLSCHVNGSSRYIYMYMCVKVKGYH